MSLQLALKINESDNVATIFANDIIAGSQVEVRDKKGNSEIIKVLGNVPYGHKIALKCIHKGEQIIKYGEEIGVATKEIGVGEYVHTHNLDSMRGRGDLKGESVK